MKIWTIRWVDKKTGKIEKVKYYRSEKTFDYNWAYHTEFYDYCFRIGINHVNMEGRDPDDKLIREHKK